MKTGVKAFLFGFLIFASFQTPVSAQEDTSWVQKVKSFFKSSSPAERENTVVSEKKEQPQAAVVKKPMFDFSEKTIGNREAPIKILVFTSLTCPHCTNLHTQLLPYLREKYVDTNEALLILNDFPLEPRAMTASMVSRCLSGDSYFSFIDTLFENQRHWAVAPNVQESLLPYAKLAGLTEEEMTACATDESVSKEIIRQRNLAIMRYKIKVTPTLLIQLGKEKEKFEGAPGRADVDQVIEKLKKSYTGPWPSSEKTEQPSPSAP